MIVEVDECRVSFEAADECLEAIVYPLRNEVGITDKMLEQEYKKIIVEH